MLKATLKTLTVLFLFSVILTSCKKKNEQKSKMELLTQKEWFMSKYEEKTNASSWVDDFPNWQACEKDNKFIFRTNNTLEENEGATKCDVADPQIVGTTAWAFTDGETKITVNGSATIDQLDENAFVITVSDTFNGTTYYERITFRH